MTEFACTFPDHQRWRFDQGIDRDSESIVVLCVALFFGPGEVFAIQVRLRVVGVVVLGAGIDQHTDSQDQHSMVFGGR